MTSLETGIVHIEYGEGRHFRLLCGAQVQDVAFSTYEDYFSIGDLLRHYPEIPLTEDASLYEFTTLCPKLGFLLELRWCTACVRHPHLPLYVASNLQL